MKLPKTSTRGLEPRSSLEADGLLAVVGFQAEVGGAVADARALLQGADLAAEQAANEHLGRWPIAGREGPRHPGQQGIAEVVGGQVFLALRCPFEEVQQFLLGQPAVALGVHAAEQAIDHVRLLDVWVVVGPVEIVSGDAAVLVAVQASKRLVVAVKFVPDDPPALSGPCN